MAFYTDIERVKPAYANTFTPGELIVVEEKVDSANSSINFDFETNSLVARSRKTILSEASTLNGFYDLVQEFNVDAFKKVFGERYVPFGEWTGSQHSIKYPDYVRKKFWMFDVYDKKTHQYVSFTSCKIFFERWIEEDEVVRHNCSFVPVFYEGPFVSWEHLSSFVGQTYLKAEPCGEGIVIKRQEHLDSKSSKLPYYVKIVHEKFSEIHSSKPHKIDPEKLEKQAKEREIVASIVTPQRIDKILFKLIDEDLVPADWNTSEMKVISSLLPRAVYKDCVKEENEIVSSCDNFGKVFGGLTMERVRFLLNEKNSI